MGTRVSFLSPSVVSVVIRVGERFQGYSKGILDQTLIQDREIRESSLRLPWRPAKWVQSRP